MNGVDPRSMQVMAVAPALYEACEHALCYLSSHSFHLNKQSLPSTISTLRAAIKMAEVDGQPNDFVQLVYAAQSLMIYATSHGDAFPDTREVTSKHPRDENGCIWIQEYLDLKEALKPFPTSEMEEI